MWLSFLPFYITFSEVASWSKFNRIVLTDHS